jgi:hypothetical protein
LTNGAAPLCPQRRVGDAGVLREMLVEDLRMARRGTLHAVWSA